jgi:hypothetical protein
MYTVLLLRPCSLLREKVTFTQNWAIFFVVARLGFADWVFNSLIGEWLPCVRTDELPKQPTEDTQQTTPTRRMTICPHRTASLALWVSTVVVPQSLAAPACHTYSALSICCSGGTQRSSQWCRLAQVAGAVVAVAVVAGASSGNPKGS